MSATGRNFQRDRGIVRQLPEKHSLEPYRAEHGRIKAALKINLSLGYIATCDPGQDRFLCKLQIEHPARWQGSGQEILVLEREFLHLDTIIDWLLNLEEPVMSALFSDCREDIKDRDVIRVLLALVDQIRSLAVALAEDEKTRRKILE